MAKHIITSIILFGALFVFLVIPTFAEGGQQWSEDTLTWNITPPRDIEEELAAWNRSSNEAVGFKVIDARADEVQQWLPFRHSYPTSPPPPQDYQKFFAAEDFSWMVTCQFDDATGNLRACDMYH